MGYDKINHGISRRSFLSGTMAAGGLVALGALGGCAPSQSQEAVATKGTETPATQSTPSSDWLGESPNVNEADLAETIETEILVIGAGCSGMFAACHAAEAGSKVLLIEANETGVGIRSSALSAVGSRYQIAAGADINKEDIINDFASYALNQCDIALMRNWVDNSAEMIDWYGDLLEQNGYTFQLEWNMPQGTRYKMWPTGHGTISEGGGRADEAAVLAIVIKYFEEQGGTFMNKTALSSLVQEDGKVVGIYALNSDKKTIRINASKGVVVATGGYVNNEEMYIARQNGLEKSLSGPLNFGTAKGDGIKACLWAGARMDRIATTMIFDRGVVKPEEELGQVFSGGEFKHFTFATQPFLKVSKAGTRTTNESSPYDYIVHASQEKPGAAWYSIWDSTWKEDVTRFFTIGCSTLFSREGSNHHAPGLDAVEAQMEEMVTDGFIIKADTLEDIAKGLLLDDTDAFVAEVANYNKLFQAGYDSQYGKDSFRLSGLDTPPYYGMKIGGEPLCTLDGIVVDAQYRALDENDEPIEGLYVIGNDGGQYYAHTYPNFAAGCNAGRVATAGMMVGKALGSQ